MVKSLADILGNKWDEPPEIRAIKDYVGTKYKEDVAVSLSGSQLRIHAASSALAATLRMDIENLKQAVKTDKKLVILVG